jgi:hypothetical protein
MSTQGFQRASGLKELADISNGLTICTNLGHNIFYIIYINSVRTSQETHYVPATKPNRLMLFRETVAVYCENHTEHTDTLRGQNAEFYCVQSVPHRKHITSPLQTPTG